uniref:Uncharacterized protein n=1 Tax=Cacopsylla melanoneura TaxID=428564 RepID=A0A8D9A7K9_9HEMI
MSWRAKWQYSALGALPYNHFLLLCILQQASSRAPFLEPPKPRTPRFYSNDISFFSPSNISLKKSFGSILTKNSVSSFLKSAEFGILEILDMGPLFLPILFFHIILHFIMTKFHHDIN